MIRRYDQRYENLLGAIFSAILFGACVAYESRRRRQLRSGNAATVGRRWRDEREVRAVLYCFASLQIIAIPLSFDKAIAAGPCCAQSELHLTETAARHARRTWYMGS
jgi:hypothetical protein